MTHSRTFRFLFVVTLVTISLVTVAVPGWLLWPESRYRAVVNLEGIDVKLSVACLHRYSVKQ